MNNKKNNYSPLSTTFVTVTEKEIIIVVVIIIIMIINCNYTVSSTQDNKHINCFFLFSGVIWHTWENIKTYGK
jgi:hypothetical protein